MNTVNKIVLAIREAINAVKAINPDQSVTDGFSVAVFENNGEFTAEVFFGVDSEKTVWYYEPNEFDFEIKADIQALLENSDGCHDELINIAETFINEDWIQTI